MPPALRTVVVAADRRTLRASSRLLGTEPSLKLCGFAQDAETGAEVARAVGAELVLLDARLEHADATAWPVAARRVLLLDAEPTRPREALPHDVADVVEAMSSHRPYRAGLGIDKALAEIEARRGTWFEPAAVDACLRL